MSCSAGDIPADDDDDVIDDVAAETEFAGCAGGGVATAAAAAAAAGVGDDDDDDDDVSGSMAASITRRVERWLEVILAIELWEERICHLKIIMMMLISRSMALGLNLMPDERQIWRNRPRTMSRSNEQTSSERENRRLIRDLRVRLRITSLRILFSLRVVIFCDRSRCDSTYTISLPMFNTSAALYSLDMFC